MAVAPVPLKLTSVLRGASWKCSSLDRSHIRALRKVNEDIVLVWRLQHMIHATKLIFLHIL
jgi:hypothetical protein